jgi:L-asparaginase II
LSFAVLAPAPLGVVGCAIAVLGPPVLALARGMAHLADPKGLGPARAAACRRILEAMAAKPLLVGGSSAFGSYLLQTLGMKALVKGGAEGVYCAALPGLGYGVALKIADGAARAAEIAMGAVLQRLGLLPDPVPTALAERLALPIRNVAGRLVGTLRPAAVTTGS